ncbi:YveK family protein [Eupransor demetentiae]|uniref:Capsular polysaccharide biosynthesis protein CpsC n=1 Tax=Eupransor demetentiae TaxID=3109584 RepID=A0ABM9N4P7_9LACO|nr:Capsular polysaccharide biosynthesis protein YveK (YveK) [Lactobacillaceae bacterium LMG 33000]
MENVFDLSQLLELLKKNWKKMFFLAALFGIAGFSYAKIAIQPTYQATVSILVNRKADGKEKDSNQVDDQQAAIQLITTYKDIIARPIIQEAVAKNLSDKSNDLPRHYPGMTASQVSGMLSTNSTNNSQVFSVNARSKNPQMAADVANETAQVFKQKIYSLMNIKNVSILSKADGHLSPVSPNVKMITLAAAVLGLLVGMLWGLLQFLTDRSVKEISYLTDDLGLLNLGEVSYIGALPTVGQKLNEEAQQRQTLIEN